MNSTLVRDGLQIQCTVAVPGHSTLADLDIDYQGAELTVSVNAESIVLSLPLHDGDEVQEDSIAAKWDKATRKLIIDLLVLPRPQEARPDPCLLGPAAFEDALYREASIRELEADGGNTVEHDAAAATKAVEESEAARG